MPVHDSESRANATVWNRVGDTQSSQAEQRSCNTAESRQENNDRNKSRRIQSHRFVYTVCDAVTCSCATCARVWRSCEASSQSARAWNVDPERIVSGSKQSRCRTGPDCISRSRIDTKPFVKQRLDSKAVLSGAWQTRECTEAKMIDLKSVVWPAGASVLEFLFATPRSVP